MNIEAKIKVELRIDEARIPVERRCSSGDGGEGGVVGLGDGVAEGFLFVSSGIPEERSSLAQR